MVQHSKVITHPHSIIPMDVLDRMHMLIKALPLFSLD